MEIRSGKQKNIYTYPSKNMFSARFITEDLVLLLDEGSTAQILDINTLDTWVLHDKRGDFLLNQDSIEPSDYNSIIMTGFNIIFLKKDKDNSYNQSVIYSNTPSDIPTVRDYFTSRELPYVDFTPPALDRSEGFIISRSHHLKADAFGVLDNKTNTMVIATGYTWPNFSANAFLPIFWIADDQGVLYNRNPKYIIDGGGIAPRIFPVAQPILLLRLPPTATQTP